MKWNYRRVPVAVVLATVALSICIVTASLSGGAYSAPATASLSPLACLKCHTDTDLAEKQKAKTGSRDPNYIVNYVSMLKRLRAEQQQLAYANQHESEFDRLRKIFRPGQIL